jgi:hypothetical protein
MKLQRAELFGAGASTESNSYLGTKRLRGSLTGLACFGAASARVKVFLSSFFIVFWPCGDGETG